VGYRLKPGRPVDRELRRIAEKQFELALAAMQGVGSRSRDKAMHRARRHIKKIRALIRLFQPSLAHAYPPIDRRLRAVSRRLAPIADGEAVVDTLVRIGRKYRQELPGATFNSIHAGLVHREFRADRKATFDRSLETATRLLRLEQGRIHLWRLRESGFSAVARGLESSVRRTRRAMTRALEQPTDRHYRQWRQRVKDLWLQVRLLEGRCGGRLAREESQLERLDDCLGEYLNCALLARVLTAEPLASRQETVTCLRLLRRYREELRREIGPLANITLSEKPRRFVRRVHRQWRLAMTLRKGIGQVDRSAERVVHSSTWW
jgi:CHAD domain-containing protein